MSYAYYVHPIFQGKGGWDKVDVLANAELGRPHEIGPMTAALLAGLFKGFEGNGVVSWQDIMSELNRITPHSRPGVSGARDNRFSPQSEPEPEEVVFENTTPLAIPDGDDTGVTSEIEVTEDLVVRSLVVDLEVQHSYVGDLHITLTHDDKEAVVWTFSGGSDGGLSVSIELDQFDGMNAAGLTWLHVLWQRRGVLRRYTDCIH